MRNNSNKFIFICSLIIIFSLISGCNLVGFREFKDDTEFLTTEECIENRIKRYIASYPNEKEHYSLETIVYSFENCNQCIIIFNTPDTTLWMYILDKIEKQKNILYIYNYSETISLYDEWKNIGDYKYKVANLTDDLSEYKNNDIDIERICYFQYGKQYESYFLLLDETLKKDEI